MSILLNDRIFNFVINNHFLNCSLEKVFVRAEGSGGRGSVAAKSVGAKFSEQLKDLRIRIDATAPHYIRCLKPNDDLLPNGE